MDTLDARRSLVLATLIIGGCAERSLGFDDDPRDTTHDLGRFAAHDFAGVMQSGGSDPATADGGTEVDSPSITDGGTEVDYQLTPCEAQLHEPCPAPKKCFLLQPIVGFGIVLFLMPQDRNTDPVSVYGLRVNHAGPVSSIYFIDSDDNYDELNDYMFGGVKKTPVAGFVNTDFATGCADTIPPSGSSVPLSGCYKPEATKPMLGFTMGTDPFPGMEAQIISDATLAVCTTASK